MTATTPAQFWLMKTEPEEFSIDDLARDGRTWWEGVRNYQARNIMRDRMKPGDLALVHHSSAKPPGIAGVGRISKPARPEREDPRWVAVEVEFVEKFARFLPMEVLRATPGLDGLMLLRRGARLSVQPVSPEHFERIVAMGRKGGRAS